MSKMVSATGTFAACSAATFPCAVPVLPEMMAPACPIRFPGGVGGDRAGPVYADHQHGARHVDNRKPLADADEQFDAGASCCHKGVGCKRTWNKDARGCRPGSGSGLGNGIEHRQPLDSFSS